MNNVHVCRTRNRNEPKMFSPVNFSITNYSTDAQSKAMKNPLGDALFFNNINNLHLIPDPLKKNLADSVITGTMEQRKERDKFEKPPPTSESGTLGSLGGITNFFSGVFNVMTAMFQKRASSPTTQYYDCFDAVDDGQMTPSLPWQPAKFEVQNRNSTPNSNDMDNMTVIANCKDKINNVHLLLNGNIQKCPATMYVEPKSVEDSFEDAFCPENIVQLANDTLIECYTAYNQHQQELLEVEAPVIKTEFCNESTDIVKILPETDRKQPDMDRTEKDLNTVTCNSKEREIVSTCEVKLNKLKELLQCKHKQNVNSVQETTAIPIKGVISSSFANEIDAPRETKNSFDEVNGRFYSSSVDSDDSFQIVFTDRKRIPSDCESEDSFIVFDESPDCYTNVDVFGSDSESETEDSGYVMTCLNHSLSRTFGDLTDDSLYGNDVVDCAVQPGHAVEPEKITMSDATQSKIPTEDKNQKPFKKVRFSTDPPKVHVMRVWAFAARQARAGHWERHALDRDRFRRRIADVEMGISWVLKPQHRTRVMFQRFMPWWNAEKRRELEERKALESEKEYLEKETENNKEYVAVTDFDLNESENAGDNISLKENTGCGGNISLNNMSDNGLLNNELHTFNSLDCKGCDQEVENISKSNMETLKPIIETGHIREKCNLQDGQKCTDKEDESIHINKFIKENEFQKRVVNVTGNTDNGLDSDNNVDDK
ncbi:uncharacterized protein LOC125055004 [Pieris napi]|uniref:uncharacterized protein LOC125055004 n=1 Tax=Pieris napi TaxID=78633 RepID=UPI001FBACF79|nr:uncharacterized protein LOC125055004 [Pieris napi]